MNLQFEHLTQNDIPKIKILFDESKEDFDEGWVMAFLSQSHNIALVAKLDNVPIGLIYGYSLTCMEVRRPQFFIYSVDIFEGYQDKGYGGRFVKYAVDWARDNGFSESFVMTHKSNLRACAVYEKAGMTHSEDDCERMYVAEYDNNSPLDN